MPLPESIAHLIEGARRRLLASNATHLVILAVGLTAALAAALVAIARFVVLPWAETVAVAAIATAIVVALIVSLLRRPSPARAALAVDRRLGGFDRVSTALELSQREALDDLDRRQVTAAGAWAHNRTFDGFGRILPSGSMPRLAAAAVVCLLVLALVPSTADVALARRQAEIDLITDEIERLSRGGSGSPGRSA